ncbi:hypothetical protein AGMMS49982_01360 [Bacteroidia bacterium]|nr:hypothetical protein AGMMS49982_01360 [Bacteroidia bacterium]
MMKKLILFIDLIAFNCSIFANFQDTLPPSLKIDRAYDYIQFYDADVAKRLVAHFDNVGKDKLVILHFGDSHIQAENATTYTRNELQNDYGDGGRGMIVNYSAAKTYSSINYTTDKTGEWTYAKSFQIPPKLPLGITGMTVETTEDNAELHFAFKTPVPATAHKIVVFFENNDRTSDFNLLIDKTLYTFTNQQLSALNQNYVEVSYFGTINEISLHIASNTNGSAYFRFYGIDIEKTDNKGITYHSLGVGAASMRSMLYLDKLPEQAKLLKPDVAVIDFGTNDILYYNEVEANLPSTISQIIKKLRDVNPEMLIILTSTQDLFRHGRYITAGPKFRDLVASIARAEHTMFWNWYDLSGGLHSIRDWYNAGYAQSDCIHLTAKGYAAKGSFLYSSIKNTIKLVKQNPNIQQHTVPMKDYADILKKHADDFSPSITYKVKPGDTLFAIALRYHTTVKAIMQTNKLDSDLLRIGQILEIPKSK